MRMVSASIVSRACPVHKRSVSIMAMVLLPRGTRLSRQKVNSQTLRAAHRRDRLTTSCRTSACMNLSPDIAKHLAARICGVVLSLAVLVGGAASAEELTLRFKASAQPSVREAQTRLVQTYAYVKYYYVDEQYGGVDWDAAFESALQQSRDASDASAVDAITNNLLAKLGDPYTRQLDAQATSMFNADRGGQLLSFGLGVDCPAASAVAANACAVAFVAPNGPAERSGLTGGELITAVDGRALDEDGSRQFKALLESRSQPSVKLEVRAAETTAKRDQRAREVTLDMASVGIDPIQFGTVPAPSGVQTGYVRIGVFSTATGSSLDRALHALQGKDVRGLVVDLRDNPGGQVGAGLDVAQQMLPANSTLVSVSGRGGATEDVVVPQSDSELLKVPTAVLTNATTASTSEMLASALRAQGAVLIGEPTTGKGRSQNVFELPGGHLLLVSVLRYIGASGEVIDGTGLAPDVVCKPEQVSEERYVSGELAQDIDLLADPCIDLAVKHLAKQT